jgi:hypothetical protein
MVDVQHLEDKIASKLALLSWKNVTIAGCHVFVYAILPLQAIYHIISLDLAVKVPKNIKSLLRAYLLAYCDKASRGSAR